MKGKAYKKLDKLLTVVLTLAIIVSISPVFNMNAYAAGASYGYTTDSNGLMEYNPNANNGYDFKGYVNGAWQQVTYNDNGFAAGIYNGNGIGISSEAKFISDGQAIQITYTLKNNSSSDISGYRFYIAADTTLAGDDASRNEIEDGVVIMTSGSVSFFALSTTDGGTAVATEYYDATVSYCDVCYGADPSTVTSVSDVYDSAFVMYFSSDTLAAGKEKEYTFIVGMGDSGSIKTVVSSVKNALNAAPDYENETFKDLEAGGTYTIQIVGESTVYLFTASANGTIPLTGTDNNGLAYDFIGKSVTIIHKGDGINTADSDEMNMSVSERPEAQEPEQLTNTPTDINNEDITTTNNSITVNGLATQEYSLISNGNWVKPVSGKVTFTGLNELTDYTIYTRVAATDSAPASLVSNGVTVKTMGMFNDLVKNEYAGSFTNTDHALTVSTSVEGAEITYCDTLNGTYVSSPYSFRYTGTNTVYYCVSKENYYNAYGTLTADITGHLYEYSAEGNVITAKCLDQNCEYYENGISLTLTADAGSYIGGPISKSSIFSGVIFSAFNAATGNSVSLANIKVYASDDTERQNELSQIIYPNNYTACITVGNETAETEFTVTKAVQPASTVTMEDYAYNGTVSTPVLDKSIAEDAEVTWTYGTDSSNIDKTWDTETMKTLPIGLYFIKASIAATDNYFEKEIIGTFSVVKASQSAPVIESAIGEGVVTISENDRDRDLQYVVLITGRPNNNTQWTNVVLDENGAFTIAGLKANTSYTVYIRAKGNSITNPSECACSSFTTPSQYSVYYSLNGGTGTVPESQTENSGKAITVVNGNGFSRTGYSFTGWNTKADGTGTSYISGDSITSGTVLFAQWKANRYTVKFNANGGTGTMAEEILDYGQSANLTKNTYEKENYTFAGWSTKSNGLAMFKDEQSVCNLATTGTVTLYAVWTENVYDLTVKVKSQSSEDAAVKIMKGNVEYTTMTVTDFVNNEGSVVFENMVPGTYNVVIEQAGVTVTGMAVVTADSTVKLIVPSGNINSVLDVVGQNTPQLVVGGLNNEAASKSQNGKTVTVKMTVEKPEEGNSFDAATETQEQTQAAIEKIKKEAADKTLDYLNINISQIITTSTSTESTSILETNNVCEIVVPYDTTGKQNITIYRCHEDEVQEFTSLEEKPAEPEDGTFYVDGTNGLIYIYAQKFSTYAVGYVPVKTMGSSNYTVNVPETVNGTVSLSKNLSSSGETITLNIKPDEGFTVGKVTVKDSKGNAITLTKIDDNTYTFKMPAGNVTVSVSFKDASEIVPDYSECRHDETCVYADFEDADLNGWYHDGIHFCVQNGYMNGVSDTSFAPNDELTRAMIVTILWNIEGKPICNYSMSFADVEGEQWYTEAIRWAQSTGIVDGYNANSFGPEDSVTREQLAAILMRYAEYKEIDVSGKYDLSGFTDESSVSNWAVENVGWANAAGIISGRTSTTIVPNGNATRAETASMIMRLCSNILVSE